MNLYNDQIQLLEQTEAAIEFLFMENGKVFSVDFNRLEPEKPFTLGRCETTDQVLLKEEVDEDHVVVYVKNQNILAVRMGPVPNEKFQASETSYPLTIETFSEVLSFKQTGETTFSVYDNQGSFLFSVHDFAVNHRMAFLYPVDLGLSTVDYRFLTVAKIQYASFTLFFVYDLFKKELTGKNIIFSIESNDARLQYELVSPNELAIASENVQHVIDFRRIPAKGKRIFTIYQLEEFRNEHLLGTFKINGATYYLHNKAKGVFLSRTNPMRVAGFQTNMKIRFIGKNLYIVGRYTHYAYKASGKYDYLYIGSQEKPAAKFNRPLNVRLFRRYGFFKVPAAALLAEDREEQQLYIGNEKTVLHPLKLKKSPRRSAAMDFKSYGDRTAVIQTNTRGNVTSTIVPKTDEHTEKERFSIILNNIKNSKYTTKVFRSLFSFMGKLPKKKKLVIFESFHAKQYSDNPRAVYEYMREYHKDYQLLWSIDKSAAKLFDEFKVPAIQRFTFRWFLTFPRAKYWVNNVRLPVWMPKPPGTVYVQTWHGTPLKRLGLDIADVQMPGTKTDTYQRSFVNESKKWDYLVSPNPYSTEIFKRAFHFKGKVIESGYPRNDALSNYSSETVSEIKQRLGIPVEKKVMLYAPTWRDNEFYEKGKYKFEFQFDLDNWKKEFGSEFVLLARMHYLIAENFDFSAHEGFVIDASAYPDIRDLYLVSDLLITDYSSVFFDYAILDRPILFFMYDLEKYRDQLRGFYINIEEEAPGPIVQSEEELFQALHELGHKDVQSEPAFEAFKDKFSSLEDGHAAERVVQAFLQEPDKK